MGLTIEELYAFKENYQNQIEELERKKAVVDEFILFAEAKQISDIQEQTLEVEKADFEEEKEE